MSKRATITQNIAYPWHQEEEQINHGKQYTSQKQKKNKAMVTRWSQCWTGSSTQHNNKTAKRTNHEKSSAISSYNSTRFRFRNLSSKITRASCSKLTLLLVNVLLKLISLNEAYKQIFLLTKMWVAFAFAKATHIVFSKNACELDIVFTRIVKILTTNELVKLTMFWTTGSWEWNRCDCTKSSRLVFRCCKNTK